ncbi:uncharacterized protein LOC103854065 isoform X2 [Brassica rapa]|uniref:uncharacterized protein LOC103854065 isoform X2 n=1 Tax=Brassica campestris TaxID=3711 RepID=UPI0008729591|nr:uncharacterized protein LOC103854065 isoform X2 [Brassica rapa]
MIGELNAIRSTITDRIPGAQCVILTLRLQSGDNVCVSMFDSMALAFHSKLESCGKESKIVLATSVNPKIVGDNTTMAKKVKNIVELQKRPKENLYLSQRDIRELKCFLFFLAVITVWMSLSISRNTSAVEREILL